MCEQTDYRSQWPRQCHNRSIHQPKRDRITVRQYDQHHCGRPDTHSVLSARHVEVHSTDCRGHQSHCASQRPLHSIPGQRTNDLGTAAIRKWDCARTCCTGARRLLAVRLRRLVTVSMALRDWEVCEPRIAFSGGCFAGMSRPFQCGGHWRCTPLTRTLAGRVAHV